MTLCMTLSHILSLIFICLCSHPCDMSRAKKERVRLTITIPKELNDWMDKKIEDLTFGHKSQIVEKAIKLLPEYKESK